ncbi:carbonic anhydrase [Nesidiocoris tenuis]|uniref:Carbonic anhydrase n=2 Tax=Nesidiocoris tenuis TaxID=355587 RepID=A0ABN7AIQ8_9HEMI|nr:carbonic anhydrase [Nesidiocoris tenuis]
MRLIPDYKGRALQQLHIPLLNITVGTRLLPGTPELTNTRKSQAIQLQQRTPSLAHRRTSLPHHVKKLYQMRFFLLVFVAVVAPIALAHLETSDLEETVDMKLDDIQYFKKKNSLRGGDKKGDALYDYDGGPGTSAWDGACATGKAQSPISFQPHQSAPVYRRVLRFTGLQQTPLSTNITNSGHSVKVKLRTLKPITVSGGVLGEKVYEFQQIHFHWGKVPKEGSEHTIGAKSFPLEAHFVFYKANSKNPSAEEDGITVLGLTYEIGKTNAVLDPITKIVDQIVMPGQFVSRSGGFTLQDYLPRDMDTYFNYRGSLTTPPCSEGVTWVWFTDNRQVSDRQVSQFRKIKDDLGLNVIYNFRETQPLNGRKVMLVKSSDKIVL